MLDAVMTVSALVMGCAGMWMAGTQLLRRRADRGVGVGSVLPALRLPKRDGSGDFDLGGGRPERLLLLLMKGDW